MSQPPDRHSVYDWLLFDSLSVIVRNSHAKQIAAEKKPEIREFSCTFEAEKVTNNCLCADAQISFVPIYFHVAHHSMRSEIVCVEERFYPIWLEKGKVERRHWNRQYITQSNAHTNTHTHKHTRTPIPARIQKYKKKKRIATGGNECRGKC